MAQYSTKDFESALAKKGFRNDKSGSHKFYYFYLHGKKSSVFTFVSHGESEFNDSLASQRRKQMGNLTASQFNNFIKCPMSQEDLIEHLKSSGRITDE